MKFAIVASLIAVAPQPAIAQAAPLQPFGKWSVSYEPASCVLFREFDNNSTKATLLITTSPIGTGAEIALLTFDKGKADYREGVASLKADGVSISAEKFTTAVAPTAKVRASRTSVDSAVLPTLARATTLSVPVTLDRNITLATNGLATALRAADKCRADLRQSWGFDSAMDARVVTPAAGANIGDWITDGDYPPQAAFQGLGGDSVIIWKIDNQGMIKDCRTVKSSGHKFLDAAACGAVTRRGRYSPARDADGRAVESWSGRTVKWRAP